MCLPDAYFQAAPSEATWTFTVTPGQYRVAATWFDTAGIAAFASVAPFSVLDGAAIEGTFTLNQRNAPNDFFADGDFWENIGGQFDITSTTLTVRLTNAGANGYVLADAIRLFRVGPPGNSEPDPGGGGSSSLPVVPPSGGTLRGEESDSQNAALLNTVYWNDELDDVTTVLAEDDTRDPTYDHVAVGRIDELDANELELALTDWL